MYMAQGCITKTYTELKQVKINMILNDLSPVVDSQNLNLNLGSGFVVILHLIQYPHYLMMHKLIIHHVCLCFSAAVRRNRLTSDATEKDIDSTVKRWLYLAPDRDGGRKERMKSKVHKDNMTG